MAWALEKEGTWIELFGQGFTAVQIVNGEPDELRFPGNWPDLATDEERAAVGIKLIVEPDGVPAGQRLVSSHIEGEETPRRIFVIEPIALAELRADAITRVNVDAGNFRRQFITDIPGQQATYLAKEAEAQAWALGADEAGFPYLAFEAAETGQAIGEIAAVVLATAAQWRGLDPKIEGKRRGACVAIGAASTAEEIFAAAAIDWQALLA